MELANQMLSLLFVLFLSTQIDCTRTKRMFALCPPHFVRIGNECYFISQNRVNWLDAHFECKDKNSRLAEPFKQEDRSLRKYLNHITGLRPDDLWIGARFNWELNKWQWGTNGKYLTYQSFSQMSAGNKDLKFHCAILKPNLKYRWSASSCEIEHQYICQHRMPYVNEKNRQKIYNKWNETYPHEMANEIEIVLSEDDLLRRRKMQQRSHLRPHHNRHIKHGQNDRRRNDIRLNNLHGRNQPQNAWQKKHAGNKRWRNANVNRKFDLKPNRAGGIRQAIQFNHTNNWHQTHMSHPYDQRLGWQKQKWNTKLRPTTTNSPWRIFNLSTIAKTTTTPMPTTTTTTTPLTTTTTMRTTTTTPPPPPPSTPSPTTKWLSNDVYSDDEQMRKQQEEREQRLYEDEQRENQEYMDKLRRIEEERLRNEERIRAKHLKEMEQRQKQLLEEQQHQKELDQLQQQRKEQEAERQRQNDINKMIYQTEQQNRQAEIRQREQQAHHDEHAIQTNEVLDDSNISSSTTISPIEKKRLKNKKLHERLSKLSIEEQNLFFQRRAEKHKKRQVAHETVINTPEPK